jgi:hypothetical protein
MRTLYLTSPLMTGKDALDVQTRLKAKGYDPGPLDGKYGPETVYAVRTFQNANRLAVDGMYGPLTAKALAAKPKPPPAPKPTSNGVKALGEAVKHIGVKESPARSNRTMFGQWFGIDGVPWCVIFVSYCFDAGAGQLLGSGNNPARGFFPKGMAYVPYLEAWLKTSGQWAGKVAPQPGDIAVYDFDGGVADHTGIVEKYLGGGKFTAIEGNTAVGNDANGGEVMRRTRYLSQVHGFGRLR